MKSNLNIPLYIITIFTKILRIVHTLTFLILRKHLKVQLNNGLENEQIDNLNIVLFLEVHDYCSFFGINQVHVCEHFMNLSRIFLCFCSL